MTCYIATYEDLLRDGLIVQLRSNGRYVEVPVPRWELEDAIHPQVIMRVTLEKLIRAWEKMYGQELYIIEPAQEGVEWLVTDVPPDVDGEVIPFEIPAKGTLPWDDPNRDVMADIREVLERDKRKAIEGR